jgi:hypothetical protein
LEGSWFEAMVWQVVQKTPISKISRAKGTAGVAVVVECLLCKHEALNVNPNPTKQKRVLCRIGT